MAPQKPLSAPEVLFFWEGGEGAKTEGEEFCVHLPLKTVLVVTYCAIVYTPFATRVIRLNQRANQARGTKFGHHVFSL